MTRLCWLASARASVASVSSTPTASRVPLRHSEPPRTATRLTVGDRLEQPRAGGVDEADAGADELERARVREPPRAGRRDVDDGSDARFGELLGGDAIEVDVVDDGEIPGSQALDEILRSAAEPGRAHDVRHERGSEAITARNSSPPSIRSSSERLSAADSSSIRVCVGSPATFSTLKCRSATRAICGRCVIVIT